MITIGRRRKNDSGALTTSTYDVVNQLTTSVDPAGVTTYAYDGAGNLRTATAPAGGITTNVWDDENRRTRVLKPDGVINTSTYNGEGLRVEKQDTAGTPRFVWDFQNYLAELDETNTSKRIYVHSPDAYGRLISQIRLPNSVDYYFFNALGSVVGGITGQNYLRRMP